MARAAPQPDPHDDTLVKNAGVTLPPSTRVTPMLRQWLEAKAKAKDAVLLFRMGDFYELFGNDAHLAAGVLDLAVTTRDRDKGEDAMPMAGFPHVQAPVYIARLIAAGLKVAVCDQLEDPALARGIVRRDITRVVTPGMVLEDESLEARANNFLVGISVAGSVDDGFGLAALDVSTGELLAMVVTGQEILIEEVARLGPREIVAEEGLLAAVAEPLGAGARARVERRPAPRGRRLLDGLGALDASFLEPAQAPALRACELALQYVEETGQGRLPTHLQPPRPHLVDDHLLLDPITRAHLELAGPPGNRRKEGTLLSVLDRTRTAAGGRRLLRMLAAPSSARQVVEGRLERVQALVDGPGLRAALAEALTGFPDLERLVARAASGRAGPRDLGRVRVALRVLPRVAELCAVLPADMAVASGSGPLLDLNAELGCALERALVEEPAATLGAGPVFAVGWDTQLDELTGLASGGRERIAALEEEEKRLTGIPTLKVRYTSVFGYYIEVTKAQLAKVPERYRRKQTVANAERYVTDALAALEDQVEGAEARKAAREQALLAELVAQVASRSAALLAVSAQTADVDAALSLAEVAVAGRWCRPRILPREERRLILEEARHPVVERALLSRGEPFVPSTVELSGQERQILVVTGPNMAGKSTLMRQVALAQVLAQMGSFVPARAAELSLCDRVFTRVGASDDLSQGRSTFMVEMTETSTILRAATPWSLVLLDEIGRGTSTYDGLSLAWAVAEHLHEVVGSRTLFATHYHELTQLSEHLQRLRNVHVVVKERNDEIVFVRTLAEGAAARSYGIQVARLAGLPPSVLERARAVLASLENPGSAGPARLPRARRQDAPGAAGAAGAAGRPQMSLFEPSTVAAPVMTREAAELLERLRATDVTRMTPLEAMNALAALADAARRKGDPGAR